MQINEGSEVSEARFTSGDWEVVNGNEHHGFYVEDSNGYTVADLYFMSKTSGLSIDHGDNSEANAHLIKTSPKMYQMLVQLQVEGGLGIARHRQIDKLLAEARGEKPVND